MPAITKRSGCGFVACTLTVPELVALLNPGIIDKTFRPSLLIKPAIPNGDPLGLAGYASVGLRWLSRYRSDTISQTVLEPQGSDLGHWEKKHGPHRG